MDDTELKSNPRKSAEILAKNNNKSPNRVTIAAPYAYVEELAVSSPSERNWRGIFIALLVIVAVLGLIVFSIVLVSPPEEGPRTKGVKLSLEDIFVKLPPPARFNGTWISDFQFVFKDMYGGVTLYNAENLSTTIIMTNSTFRQYDAVDFRISSNLKYVLLISDVIPLYKYSRLARYHLYEISARLRRPLSPKELDDKAPHLQYATWSPDGNGIAFVYENDIYYKPRVERDLVCRITKNGKPGEIYNGVPDWLYENEILHTYHTLWFSQDGLYLLYAGFNDTLVGEYQYPWYDSGNPKASYPSVRSFRYPKVQNDNPEASVWIVNLTIPKFLFPKQLLPTKSVQPGSYITSLAFYGDNNVGIVWLNRHHNQSVLNTCKIQRNYDCVELFVHKEETSWVEPITDPIFSKDVNQAIIRLPVKDGDNGHFMHACQIHHKHSIPLTHGAFELSQILGWDEDKHLIYTLSTLENSPGVRHLFKVGDTNSSQPWTCLTCQPKIDLNITQTFYGEYVNETVLNASMLANYDCQFNNVIFSQGYKYYIQECLGPDIPVLFLVETATNTRLVVLDASTRLRKKFKLLSKPQVKSIQVEIEDGYKAQVRLFLPPVLREYEDVTFPVILIVDASPSSQSVSSQFTLSWPWYLSATRSYVVAQIDARGSGFQGVRMRQEIHRRIGIVEVQDQLAVLTYLRDAFRFIDRGKIGVVGFGYGGYVAAMMMLEDTHQVLNCTVSVAPISSWKYHNSYFTEKYLGTPSKYPQDYENADLNFRAGNLKDRNFLLMYGTADTQIVSQHSILFSKALIDQEVLFQQVAYPDEDHEFSKRSLIHMYKEVDQFFNDSFGPGLEEWSDESSFFIQ